MRDPWLFARIGCFLAGPALALLACSLSCSGVEADLPAGPTSPDLVVRHGTFSQDVLLTGELQAVEAENIVVPRTPSWQVQIRWMEEDGARVEAGQKVIELDNSSFAGDLEERKLAAAKAEKEILQLEAQKAAEAAEKSFQVEQRRAELEKARIDASVPRDLLPLRDYQERKLALQRAQAEYEKSVEDYQASREAAGEDLAVRRVAQRKALYEIQLAEQAIHALTLRAPRAGILVVTDLPWEGRKLQEGDVVWAGLTVARIPQLSDMEVEALLIDVDDGRIEVGMPALCTLDAYPDIEFPGKVMEIAPIAQ